MRKPTWRKTTAWPLFWLYAVLIVYASLYPFVNWRFQAEMSWLNAAARENIAYMFSTLAVFQAEMFWLNAVALENIPYMVVTFAVFQAAMFWLNAAALENM